MNYYLSEFLGESYKEVWLEPSVDNYGCRAALVGSALKHTVTILPGFSSEIEQMAPFIKKFRLSGYSVVCVSQPAAPTSARPKHFYKNLGFSGFANTVRKALELFEIKETFVYASSIGVSTAVRLAAGNKGLVKSLAAMNPAGLFSQSPLSAAFESVYTLIVDRRRHLGAVRDAPRPPKPKVNFFVSIYRHYWDFWNLAKLVAKNLTFEDLKKVSVPILILVGEKDTLAPIGKIGNLVADFENVKVDVMPSFSHSDPNTEEKISLTVEKSVGWFKKG